VREKDNKKDFKKSSLKDNSYCNNCSRFIDCGRQMTDWRGLKVITKDKRMIKYKLRRARTTKIRFYVRYGVVRVIAPVRLPLKLIDFYVQKNACAIGECLIKENFKLKEYKNGDSFDLFGKKYGIIRKCVNGEIKTFENKILIPQNAKVMHIEYFYFVKLKEEILRIISNNNFDIGSRRIVIKQYESKWGSCSLKSLNFNLKLVLVPLDVIKYVVVHEFCHVFEPNHSRSFWKCVESFMSDYEKQRKWLIENGNKLVI
jgi:predicted metal-dependent hydrolase